MPNPHLYDSDSDYYDDCMTPAQRLACAVIDGDNEGLVDDYIEWVMDTKREVIEEMILEKQDWIDEYARTTIDFQQEP